ncbi:MAG: type I restriction enzyme HsdR N-terminal domain-containing protein [Cyclobacteriaceae bacterium]|nr:type I restriction enzyme HsdR N-terminal domain-containing protein [Cytophagales bacterium]MBX2898396.1 type I restriction enzyme HsdR N-terminal domain-containing protein [Cyclobacteriaceae bacterium]
MYKLNLPEFNIAVRKEQGKVWIFDIIRKKYVVVTPEEWVRQHFIHYLINQLNYPKSLFQVERSLSYNKLQKRSDIVILDRTGKPWMLVECKAPTIKLTQNAFNQVAVYNMTIGARFVVVTNGMAQYCFAALSQSTTEVEFLNSLPPYPA